MAQKKKIQLPRDYISYSQVSLWKQNPKRYKEIYFNGRKDLNVYNDSIEYGKMVADALEKNEDTGDLLTDAAMLLLKKYDKRDEPIYVDFKTKGGWLTLIAKPDTFNSVSHEFREYKTGKVKWTQGKADKHFQLFFYAAVIYLKYKKITTDCYLDWIETAESVTPDGISQMQPTGVIKSFKVEVGLKKILDTIDEIVKVSKEIEEAYILHTPNKNITKFLNN